MASPMGVDYNIVDDIFPPEAYGKPQGRQERRNVIDK